MHVEDVEDGKRTYTHIFVLNYWSTNPSIRMYFLMLDTRNGECSFE